jgi:hypothetical protein
MQIDECGREECTVCLQTFEAEVVAILPNCQHRLHARCQEQLNTFLTQTTTTDFLEEGGGADVTDVTDVTCICPVCRAPYSAYEVRITLPDKKTSLWACMMYCYYKSKYAIRRNAYWLGVCANLALCIFMLAMYVASICLLTMLVLKCTGCRRTPTPTRHESDEIVALKDTFLCDGGWTLGVMCILYSVHAYSHRHLFNIFK